MRLSTMNPPSYPYGHDQAPLNLPVDQRRSAAAAQILARQSERDGMPASSRFNFSAEQQIPPYLQSTANPLGVSPTLQPPAQYQNLMQFRPEAPPPMASAQAAFQQNRLHQMLLQQQQQQAFQLEANENARILAEAQRLSNLKNNIDPRFNLVPQQQPFQDNPLLRALASGTNPGPLPPADNLDLVPYMNRAERDEAKKRKAKKEEEKVLTFLGSTTRATKNGMYFDASVLSDTESDSASRRSRGGVTEPFPEKVHRMLTDCEANGNQDIVSFFPHGRAFGIHKPDRFVKEILRKYFRQSQLSSFQRQLNLYGFTRITSGPDEGGYYHELFLRGRPDLSSHMRRVGVPTLLPTGEIVSRRDRRSVDRKRSSTMLEPDFYSMKPITIKHEKKTAKDDIGKDKTSTDSKEQAEEEEQDKTSCKTNELPPSPSTE